MLTLKPANLARLSNANFSTLMARFEVTVEKSGGVELGIDAKVLEEFKANTLKFHDIVNQTIGSEITAQLEEADATRDRLFKYVRNVLLNSKNAADASIVALWDVINAKLLAVYDATIISNANSQESAQITGFVTDVRKYLTAEQIAALGITTELDEMLAANKQYDELFVSRSMEKANQEAGATLALRNLLTELYQRMVATVEYFATLKDSTDEAEQSKCLKCTTFIFAANEVIKDFKMRVEIGEAVAATAAEKKKAKMA